MARQGTNRGPARVGLLIIVILSLLLAACAEEAVEVSTTPAPATTTTTQAATTTTTQAATLTTEGATTTTEAAVMTVSQIELLAGMLQGLLTTDEVAAAIGAEPGLVDRGRQVIPPGTNQRSGFLCPEGQAILDPLGSAYDPQVSVSFSPEGEAGHGHWVTESLLYEETGQNATDFATLVAAIDACVGVEAWEATGGGGGLVRIERLDFPAMGDESYGFRVSLNEGTGEPMWTEAKGIAIRVGPGLVEVTANMIHGAPEPIAIGDGGLRLIAEAALAKVEEGLAGGEAFTVEAAAPEEVLALTYLMAGLLTTEEIGGGWVDQGRTLVPPSAGGQGFGAGVLCPEGQALAGPIGSGLDRQVFTSYRREGSPLVTGSLIPGHRDQLSQDFAIGVAALEACFGVEPWETEEAGTLRMERLDLPSLGVQSIAYYIGPGGDTGGNPWIEWHVLSILVTDLDPANDNAVVINLEVATIHDPPGQPAAALENEELIRIAEAAVERFAFPD
ncbi:MAG TPA: hypothetical protein VLS92_10805 [Acidimicrobiia bacterium]|nr:hypothetical protein [Acidimicrobiia bacterium]